MRNNNNINIYKTQRFTFKPRLRWITQQMMANSLMLNKQCLVPAQPPMNLIRVQSGGNEMGTGGQVGRRCTQIIMITEHYQTLARRVFPPTLTSHLKLSRELSISVLNVSYFFFNTCNYFYNRITDQPAA